MKQPLDIPYQTTFIMHSKARKVFLLLDPHHRITAAVALKHWATTLQEALTKKDSSCEEENTDNRLAVVSQTIIFFSGA